MYLEMLHHINYSTPGALVMQALVGDEQRIKSNMGLQQAEGRGVDLPVVRVSFSAGKLTFGFAT